MAAEAPPRSAKEDSPSEHTFPQTTTVNSEEPRGRSAQTSQPSGTSINGGLAPDIQNIVATTQLGLKLDLKQLAMYAFNAEYNPKKFAACIIRMREPRSTALVFASGKLVCTGAKTEHDARVACRKYARMIQKVGNPGVKFKDFRIQNMVGRVDCKFPIRLEGLALAHQQFSQYEPELFPGLVYRMQHPRVVLLIFVSGKVVLTGAKKDEDIRRAFQQIYPVLREFRKEQTESQKQSDSKGKRKAQEQPAAA